MDARLTTEFDKARALGPRKPVAVKTRPDSYRVSWKRVLDVGLVLLTAPISVPLIMLGMILARLDGGPAFYTQPRVGYGGRVFRMFKLRTMRVNAEQHLSEILMRDPQARSCAVTRALRVREGSFGKRRWTNCPSFGM